MIIQLKNPESLTLKEYKKLYSLTNRSDSGMKTQLSHCCCLLRSFYKKYKFVLLKENNEIIAWASLYKDTLTYNSNIPVTELSVFVDLKHRRKGYGKEIVNFVINNNPFKIEKLKVHPHDSRSLNFFANTLDHDYGTKKYSYKFRDTVVNIEWLRDVKKAA